MKSELTPIWGTHIGQDVWELQKEECIKARTLLRRVISDIRELQEMQREEMPDAAENDSTRAEVEHGMKTENKTKPLDFAINGKFLQDLFRFCKSGILEYGGPREPLLFHHDFHKVVYVIMPIKLRKLEEGNNIEEGS